MGSGSISTTTGSGGFGTATVSWTVASWTRVELQWYVNGSPSGAPSSVGTTGSASISASHGSTVSAVVSSIASVVDPPPPHDVVEDTYASPTVTVSSSPPSPPPAPGNPTVTATPVAGQPETWDITVTGTGNRKRIVVIEDGVERQVATGTSTSPLTYRYAKPAGKNTVSARGEQWNFFNSWDGASTTNSTTIPVTLGNIGWGFRL